ncbi:hypothetical protein KY290_013762 [Solanum tuberosum]|uniref:DUF1985 domain-containing protein n=1 Tax=Solanum tuberosum TaxID=4113 RepID=A0ABQ7VMP0_SOLTU|nr:hypothetical protein KY289_013878 [Solanum tuberosum]KAH0769781.1 hypothetical protein KY290_013762 [Solanum tuberosum]
MRTVVSKLLMTLSLVKRTVTMGTRRLIEKAEILEMRMMILCLCQLVQEKSLGTRLNKEKKLKCSLVWFVHSMLLAHDQSKIIDSNHIKMVDDLDFCKSYPWGKECFDLTQKYLKNKINLKKQSEVYRERGNASYALYGFPWAFLAFPHLGNYAKKSLDSPMLIPHLLRWHTTKSDNIIEGDPFKYKGRSTKVVHPYIIPTVCETKQNYMATLKPYTDEVKETIIDDLKASLKGVTVLTSAEGEKLRRNEKKKKATDLAVDDDNFSSPTVDDNILPLDVVEDDLAAVDAYFAEEVDEEMKEEEMKEEEKQQDEEKMTEKEEEKLEEKKEEESEEENLEEKKNKENEASGEEEKEQQEEKITENEEEEKLEERGLATDVAEVEKYIDVMGIVMELNGEVGGDE